MMQCGYRSPPCRQPRPFAIRVLVMYCSPWCCAPVGDTAGQALPCQFQVIATPFVSHAYSLVLIHLSILMSCVELEVGISDIHHFLLHHTIYDTTRGWQQPPTHRRLPAWLWHRTGGLGDLYGSVSGQKGCLESRYGGSAVAVGRKRQVQSSCPVVVKSVMFT